MSCGAKRVIAVGVAVSLFLGAFAGMTAFAEGGRLHPTLRRMLDVPRGGAPLDGEQQIPASLPARYHVPSLREFIEGLFSGWGRVSVLVKTGTEVVGTRFLGFPIRVNTGTVLGMAVTLAELLVLASAPEVVYVEPAWRVEPKLDASLPAIGMAYVRSAFPELTGEGVVVGLVDTGIDYLHLDFRFDRDGDGFEESSRIAALWDQTDGFFGSRYSRADIEADIASGFGPSQGVVHLDDDEGHGTRVAGILASDGSSSSAGLSGVAPGAELVVVKTPFYTSDILAGVEYIFEYAEGRGLPAVVNLSLGGHAGAHDGTSLFEQGLDELVDRPGRVVVVSAGNEGDERIHISRQLYYGSTTFSMAPTGSSLEASLWYPGDVRLHLSVALPGGGVLDIPYAASGSGATTAGDLYVDNATAGTNPNNGYHEATFRLSGSGPGQQWPVTVTLDGGGGRFHGWITGGDGYFVGGDMTYTIAEPGNARRVITVGAYNSRARWSSLAGEQDFTASYPLGELTSFSSRGPTMDGRLKPELTAPGAWIVSSRSGTAWVQNFVAYVDGVHEASLGTSFAAPHAAGVVALMLSINPQLTWSEVLDRLVDSAGEDQHTPPLPDPRWGYGKLNAALAVAAVEPPHDGGGGEPVPRPTVEATTNPAVDVASFRYELPETAAWSELRLYAVDGRLVFEVAVDPRGERVDWGLTTTAGEPVGSGLYLFVLVSDVGSSAVGRLVILR